MRSEEQRGCLRRGNGVDRWSDSSQIVRRLDGHDDNKLF